MKRKRLVHGLQNSWEFHTLLCQNGVLLLHNQTFRDSKIVFTFNDIMTKGKFEELTGIHLSELIEKTTG